MLREGVWQETKSGNIWDVNAVVIFICAHPEDSICLCFNDYEYRLFSHGMAIKYKWLKGASAGASWYTVKKKFVGKKETSPT